MTDDSGIKRPRIEEVATQLVPAASLRPGDSLLLANGRVATVRAVELYSRGRSMRDRKLPKCRIRVNIPDENNSSGGLVTASQGDCFTKLVGVRRSE